MISISTIVLILAVHFFADFIWQSNWMALGKSKAMLPLFAHIAVYTFCLCVIDWRWALVNGFVHMIVDFFSSRGSSYFWKNGERHKTFIIIGLDQMIHYICLFGLYAKMKG